MTILEKTHYSRFKSEDFVLAKEGIYFIDTDCIRNDSYKPEWDPMKPFIEKLLNPQDLDAFSASFEERRKAARDELEILKWKVQKDTEFFKNPYKNIIGKPSQKFTFSLTELGKPIEQ